MEKTHKQICGGDPGWIRTSDPQLRRLVAPRSCARRHIEREKSMAAAGDFLVHFALGECDVARNVFCGARRLHA